MIKFSILDFLSLLRELENLLRHTRPNPLNQSSEVLINEQIGHIGPLPDVLINWWFEVMGKFKNECERLELESALDQITNIEVTLSIGGGILNARNTMAQHGEQLKVRIFEGLARREFMFMPPVEAKYYEQERLFGDLVYDNFESTRSDVVEAGNCYATGRYTACVFHCMRVLEKGLHALVHDLNDRYNAGITFSRTVEETNWGNIIDEIQNTLTQPRRRGILNPPPTHEVLTFYATAAREFEFFKNAWRDDVSHSRSVYAAGTARDVLEHVRTFMQQLATKLHE